jgi:hypothetical protein
MGGAYTSKPEIPPSNPAPPDIPVNWNPDWPFPGPNPPGYDPSEGMLVAHSLDEIDPGDSVASYGRWESEFGGAAGLPNGTWTQTWTAEINGDPIGLREFGVGDFQSALSYDFGTIGTSWYGVAEDIEFDISEGDRGRTITLVIGSELGEDSYDIYIKEINTNYAKVTFSRTVGFNVTGSMSFSCAGGSVTFDSVSNSVTAATGVFVQTGTREVTVDAESLTAISGQTGSGTWSATNGGSLAQDDDFVKCTVSSQLYNEADISIIGQSSSTTFKFPLPPYGSDSETKTCMTFYEDSIVDLN